MNSTTQLVTLAAALKSQGKKVNVTVLPSQVNKRRKSMLIKGA